MLLISKLKTHLFYQVFGLYLSTSDFKKVLYIERDMKASRKNTDIKFNQVL